MKQGQIKWGGCQSDNQPPFYVLGYDEEDKKWIRVKYFSDSNRFFDFNGAVYPLDRMNKWKEIIEHN